MKKQNFGLGCSVLPREAQRIMNETFIRNADGRHLLLYGLCTCCSLGVECLFSVSLALT